jgi:hypothetical protein
VLPPKSEFDLLFEVPDFAGNFSQAIVVAASKICLNLLFALVGDLLEAEYYC